MTLAGTPQLLLSFLIREIENLREVRGVRTVGMVLVRLAGLDAVNDAHGYAGGDRVLQSGTTAIESRPNSWRPRSSKTDSP